MMEQQNYQYQDHSVFVKERSVSKKFFANVFTWMFVALAISTACAYFLSANIELLQYLTKVNIETGRATLNIYGWIVMLSPLFIFLAMSYGLHKLSYATLVLLFTVYAALFGVSLSFILMQYTGVSIISCLAAAVAIFAVMAFMGYTTDVDLSRFRSILMAGIIGMIVVSIVNIFIGSETIYYILGYIGVAIFTALTAYQIQEIKRIGEGLDEYGNEIAMVDSKKLALIAALSLYITFINLFLSLLRIFGDRR
ncbi:Bax inhibitor-1/YccA family protein [Nubsella zeaxanthinifaciens]|uniref:Bax inhibitor-1/YccA family protein n=1 Tax=Nubsella zeaxanthinifaciens TaxID=392412 RepID=UPI003D09218F